MQAEVYANKAYIGLAVQSENVSMSRHKLHRFWFVTGMRKVSSRHCSPLIHSIVSNYTVSGHEGPDQTAHMRSLIWAFTVHICPKTHFRMARPNVIISGLAFDEWDLDFYTNLFQEKIRRNPTSVECFDLAQSNRYSINQGFSFTLVPKVWWVCLSCAVGFLLTLFSRS